MVHTNIDGSCIKGPYHEIKKGKDEHVSSGQRQQQQHQQQQQQTTGKSGKYGAWGPVYKNKENFVDMHIC